ncbi:MAG: outer membrane beta-barrel protein [Bacteroidota bacterium]
MIKNFLAILFISITFSMSAQEISFGFRAGLNFNRFIADSETVGSEELEDFTNNTGFHVGAMFTWEATELMGLRAELLYNQKGGRRSYDGPSYLVLSSTSGNTIITTGNRDQNLNVTSSYIDIPVTGYFKPIEQLEIFGGFNVGFLVATTAFGEVNYSDGRFGGASIEDFRFEIDGNYLSDGPGDASFSDPPKTITIGGNQSAVIPSSAGVYVEFTEDMGNLYKIIDMGLVGGISVYLNGSLFVSARVNYGLTDITKTGADVSLREKPNNEFLTRDDDDRNFSLQASVGFSF